MSIDADTLAIIIKALALKTDTVSSPELSSNRWVGDNVIVRSADSGVHWGALAERDGSNRHFRTTRADSTTGMGRSR